MNRRRLQMTLAVTSAALVLTAAGVSRRDRWNFDFAQYRGPERAEPNDEFRFVMVGDRTGGRQPGLMPQAFREINHLYPEFVVSVGDLIDGPGPTPERIRQFWKEFDDEVSILKSPFVYVPGNHDVWNATSKGIYEERYGPTYRSFDYRGLHFITLDTEEFDATGKKLDRIDGKQLEWLKEDIARNRHAKSIIVLMHKPIWHSGGLAKAEEVWKGLPVYVFAGHVHRYSYEVIDGIPHIILGAVAGGMKESGDAIGRFRHYMLVTVRDGKLNFGLIRLGGVLAPEAVLEPELAGIRLLADACALLRDGADESSSTRMIFRNPMKSPVRLQLQRTVLVSGKLAARPIFGTGSELAVAAGEAVERVLDANLFAPPLPGMASDLRVVVEFQNDQGQPQKVDFPIEPRRRRSAAIKRPAAAPAIDGDLGDWTDAAWQSLSETGQVTYGPDSWRNRHDLSAQFALAEDDQNIYVAVRVTDDVVLAYNMTNTNTSAIEGDGIELFTACPPHGDISFSRDPDWHHLVITPPGEPAAGDAGGVPRVAAYGTNKIAPLQIAYAREVTGYVIELAFARQSIGSGGSDVNLQLDMAVNDRDQTSRRESQLTWSGTDRPSSSRHYGRVQRSR